MVNWKTTFMGLCAAVIPWIKTIIPVEVHVIVDAAQALAIALLGYFAKDAGVTGTAK